MKPIWALPLLFATVLVPDGQAAWKLVKYDVDPGSDVAFDVETGLPLGGVATARIRAVGHVIKGDASAHDQTLFGSTFVYVSTFGMQIEEWSWMPSGAELEGFVEFHLKADAEAWIDLIDSSASAAAQVEVEGEVRIDGQVYNARATGIISGSTSGNFVTSIGIGPSGPTAAMGLPGGGAGPKPGQGMTHAGKDTAYADVCAAKNYSQKLRTTGSLTAAANGHLFKAACLAGVEGKLEFKWKQLKDYDCQ